MNKTLAIALTGAHVPECAKILVRRLIELRYSAEMLDADAVARLGGPEGAAFAARLLTRNGIFAVLTEDVSGEGFPVHATEVLDHDTPDFAAEKILDELAEADAIAIDGGDYAPEEEERIRQRLADLGYID